MAQAPEAVRWARAQIVTSALRTIGNVLTQDGGGQVAIVLVSDGFERGRSSREVPSNLQSVVRVINRADAAVYAFTPSPPVAETDGTEDAGDGGVQALRRLAKDTGGDLFAGPAAFEAGFARLASDLDAHYVLTYRASHGNDGRFHAVEVAVKRPDATVRARAGYVAPMSETMRAALTPAASAPLRVLRRSALIQSWAGITPSEEGADLMLTWCRCRWRLRCGPAPRRSSSRPRPPTAPCSSTARSRRSVKGAAPRSPTMPRSRRRSDRCAWT